MKKNFLIVIMLVLFSTICMTACNNKSSISGSFKQSQYFISLEEVVDFYDELQVKGVDKKKITLSSSNDEILIKNDDNTFTGNSCGNTYILATFDDKVVASVEVYVKFELSLPKNFKVDENTGVVTWDESYTIVLGEKECADSYEISYQLEGGQDITTLTVNETTFALPQIGRYLVKITANSNKSYIESSKEKSQYINYGVIGWEEKDNLKYIASEDNSQNGRVTWGEIDNDNAIFDVYIDGVKVASDLTVNFYDFDLERYNAGQEIEVEVVAKDELNIKGPSSQKITIEILENPNIYYSLDEDGFLSCSDNESAIGYLIYATNICTGEIKTKYLVNDNNSFKSILEGFEKGIYQVELLAMGGEKDGKFYANSKPSNSIMVGKPSEVKVNVEFGENQLTLNFEDDEYNSLYRITYGDEKFIYDRKENGNKAQFNLSNLQIGNYDLTITALPSGEMIDSGNTAENVLSSDDFKFNFYKLGEVGEISNRLLGNISMFEFNQVEFANDYYLYVGNERVEVDKSFEGDRVTLRLTSLDRIQPIGNVYDIKIVAVYVENGEVHSTRPVGNKQLKVLSIVNAPFSQENGTFIWNALDEDCKYGYQIFKTDKNYNINGLDPIYSQEINGSQIYEKLSEGYYVIKVVSISNDNNISLDSNFYNNGNVFSRNFIVTRDIEMPDATFEENSGIFNLNIFTTQYSGEYEVYVDDELDGIITMSQLQDKLVYRLVNNFEDEKDYTLKVVACGGKLYDPNIYLKSQPKEFVVTRLARASFEVSDVKSDFDELLGQRLDVVSQTGSESVEFKLDGQIIEDNTQPFALDMIDKSKFGSEFSISLTVIAGQSSFNHYYLNSHEKIVNFKRVQAPNNLKYNNGILSWLNGDELASKQYITIELISPNTTNYYHRFFTSDNLSQINLQEYIDNQCKVDSQLATALRNSQKISLQMISYKNEMVEEEYLISSLNSQQLEIRQLGRVELAFDPDTKIISWECSVEGGKFDIYFDDESQPYISDYTSNSGKNVYLSIEDFLNEFNSRRKITVEAKHDSCLNSDLSLPIYIKQVASPSDITITRNGENNLVVITISSDSSNISEILVNGSSIDYVSGSAQASFNPSAFAGNDFEIILKAKNDSTINYYIDSSVINFSLIDLADCEFNAQIDNNELTWSRVAQDINAVWVNGESIDPISYIIKIDCSGKNYQISLKNQTSLALDEIERKIGQSLSGNVNLSVQAIVGESYKLGELGGQSSVVGYYGESSSISLTVEKLESIEGITKVIKANESYSNMIDRLKNSSLEISFENKWQKFGDVDFVVTIDNGQISEQLEVSSNGTVTKDYNFSLEGNVFKLFISSSIMNKFGAGKIEIGVQVKKNSTISSDIASISVNKFDTVADAVVTDEGVLEINDEQVNATYIVEISIEGSTFERVIDSEKRLDLLTEDLLLNKKGAYKIKLLAFNATNDILAGQYEYVIDGYKLEGIEKIEIDSFGRINISLFMDDFENIVFVAKRNGEEVTFIPEQSESNQKLFSITMLELLKVFDSELSMAEGNENIEIAVRKDGSVKSDYVNVEFNFAVESVNTEIKRNGDGDKDYLIFDFDKVEGTQSFRLAYTTLQKDDNNELTPVQTVIFKDATSCLGYWVTDENGENGEFTLNYNEDSGKNFVKKYGICINDILADVEFGQISLEVSRVTLTNKYYQYNSTIFDLYKLNKVNDDQTIHVSNNILSFKWENQDDLFESTFNPTSYMIYFENTSGSVHKVLTYVSSLDIRKAGLVFGESYKVYVSAISSQDSVIASNKSTNDCTTLQFTKPTTLEVKNGRLVLNNESFASSDFIADLNEYFGSENSELSYHEKVGEKNYTDLYYFNPVNLARFDISLRFTRIEDGKVTNKTYTMTTKGYNLFPDLDIEVNNRQYLEYVGTSGKLSYFSLLTLYKEKNLQGNEGLKASNVSQMIDSLSLSSRGIADSGYLFDDGGRLIPAGEYMVSLVESPFQQFVESTSSDEVRMYLSPAPEVNLYTETIDGKTNYMVNVGVVETMLYTGENETGESIYQRGNALRYKLQLRRRSDLTNLRASTIDFIIEYDQTNEKWTLRYQDYLLENVISNVERVGQIANFKLNMSMLRKQMQEIDDSVITINEMYQADIFVYNQDNGYVINGKSGMFNLRYLDLKAENIHFEDGQFIVESPTEGFELLVRYRRSSPVEQVETKRFVRGKAVIDFEETGRYEYIILSLNGSYSNSELNIESATYMLNGLYKLSSPTLSVQDGSLKISYDNRDAQYCGSVSFNMGNDISFGEDYTEEDKGYYYQRNFTLSDMVPLYVVGGRDENGNVVYSSELSASTFYAFLRGNSGQFEVSENENSLSDYLLSFGLGGLPIISSTQSSINARMLPEIDGIEVENGDIKIVNMNEIEAIFDSNNVSGSTLYEVKVEYYYVDNMDNEQYIFAGDTTLYSENQGDVEEFISGLSLSTSYSYYKVSVSLIPAILSNDEGSYGKVVTLQGNNYQILNSLVYQDGSHVLRGLVRNANEMIVRTTSPKLVNQENGVKNGAISFVISRDVYYSETDPVNIDIETANRISVYADYISAGENKTIKLTGKFQFTVSTTSGEEDNVYVLFTPDDGQLNDTIRSFTLRVYSYGKDSKGNNATISAPLTILDVYKLPKIDESNYDVILVDGKTALDFSKYFVNVSIQDNRDCYNIVASLVIADGIETITFKNSSENKTLVIPDNIVSITFQAQDAQSNSEVNIKKLLFSDEEILNPIVTEVDGLEINWNDQLKRFEWNWTNDNENKYNYYVSVNFAGRIETAFVDNNYYCPKNRGIISNNGFKLKARLINEESSNISIFSEEVVFESGPIDCSPFSGGNGSEENPYIIANATDFLNISLRNTSDVYFALNANLEIDVASLTELDYESRVLNAHINGNGFNVKVFSSELIEMEKYGNSLIGKTDLSFDYYSSLFHTISAGGDIKNLNIDYQISYNKLNSTSAIFAPICVFNYGTIDKVNITNFDISISGNVTSIDNNVFVGGVAGVNFGTIQNCNNQSVFAFNMPQQLSFNFGYAGIVLFNANQNGQRGSITNCFNKGHKQINVAVNNNIYYMAGITLTNIGSISMCGNDGDLILATRVSSVVSLTGYFAGITITNINGTLEYLYNNGRITTEASRGNFISSGIVYQISGGTINTLVETVTGQPIVRSCQSDPTDFGTNYATNNSGTAINIVVQELKNVEIQCKGDTKLTIKEDNGRFVASIK